MSFNSIATFSDNITANLFFLNISHNTLQDLTELNSLTKIAFLFGIIVNGTLINSHVSSDVSYNLITSLPVNWFLNFPAMQAL